MPSRDPKSALTDMLEHLRYAREFVGTSTFEEFCADRMCMFAVVLALEIVSEASRKLSDEQRQRMAGINWRHLADSGNVYRHAYGTVDPILIWGVLTQHLDPLEEAIIIELSRHEE